MNPNTLTTREGEIYQLIAKGMTNKEIGQTLGISHNTVSVFIGKIFMKYGYSRRNQIILAETQAQKQSNSDNGV